MKAKKVKSLNDLMILDFEELVQSGHDEELRNRYPEEYKKKSTESINCYKLALAMNMNYEELMESGFATILKKNAPEVYKLKFKEAFGKEPTVTP